jgi:hypothetical protein
LPPQLRTPIIKDFADEREVGFEMPVHANGRTF